MLLKWFFMLLGLLFLALALLGVLLPGLPTTPFLLLAAGCFSKSSSRLYNWLLNNRLFGPMIRDWQTHRSISRRVRNIAIGSMLLMGGISIFFILDQIFIQLLVGSMVLVGSYVLMRIRLTELKTD
ncbi:hypothetical protein MNBD_GAMMA18-1735 [hydrothermal vent metagenome]|uniref:Inner membrane protein YbaN n=1 Tax=hydrothermal vent metagenome TaxID=652676 RepID=A0A3B0YW90_9ZZZZ